MSEGVRQVVLEGSAAERGYQHGEQLKQEIEATIDLYSHLFALPEERIEQISVGFAERVRRFDPEQAEEMEGIAEGAAVPQHWIHALNARSEIVSLGLPECTALYFARSGILGQNWDWIDRFEDLLTVLSIRKPDGLRILTVTEPGIVGKIGLNSAGLGVCLNFLLPGRRLLGLPIHVLLRGLLDCRSLEEAAKRLEEAGVGRSGNILVGSHDGRALDVEFDGEQGHRPEANGDFFAHTNHFLARANEGNPLLENSQTRLEVAQSRTAGLEEQSVAAMTRVLSDQSHAEHPICTPYRPVFGNEVGTVCTVVMDLRQRVLHLRKGPRPAAGAEAFLNLEV